jgi:hypothetical protein
MPRPGKADFDYDYDKYRAVLNGVSAIVRDALHRPE